MYSRIDENLSAKYGITTFGRVGMCILNGGYLVKIFNNRNKSPLENWNDAVEYARARERDNQPDTYLETAFEDRVSGGYDA